MPPSRGNERPGPQPPRWAGRPLLAAQPEPGWPPTLRESAAPDGSRHARHRPQRRLPAAARRLRAPSRLSPRRGRERPGGEAGAAKRARTATARPLSRSPSRACRMGWLASRAGQQGQSDAGFGNPCAPAPPASPRGPTPRGRVLRRRCPRRLCNRLQPLGAGAPLPPRPGLQMAPASLCASRRSPGPGTSGAPRPGPHPAAAAAARAVGARGASARP